jgi:hypothetical protein
VAVRLRKPISQSNESKFCLDGRIKISFAGSAEAENLCKVALVLVVVDELGVAKPNAAKYPRRLEGKGHKTDEESGSTELGSNTLKIVS